MLWRLIWNMELEFKPENIKLTDKLWGIFPPDHMQKVVYPIGPWILQIQFPFDKDHKLLDFDENVIGFSACATLHDVLQVVQLKYGKNFTFIGFENKAEEGFKLPVFIAHLAMGRT